MDKLIRIGMGTSKSVFQLHGVNEAEQPVLRKKLRRNQVLAFFAGLSPLKIGMEACGAAHYWARELRAGPRSGVVAAAVREDSMRRRPAPLALGK